MLWSKNHPRNFWQCQPDFSNEVWNEAMCRALPMLNLPDKPEDIDSLLELTLGEGQFGPDHWRLSRSRKLYYFLKPLLPRFMTRILRQSLQRHHSLNFQLGWPIEARYPRFQFEVLKNILDLSNSSSIDFHSFWPDKKRFAFVLTHDIEGRTGQQFVRAVADLEESFGFRSSFNFVPETYLVDRGLLNELHQRGFEVGIHGLKHDGQLFNSNKEFLHCAEKINHYLKEFEAVGFRAPFTIRNPEWLQALNIEYDLSFFDTDPFEPIPGGTMSIWPFFTGHFVELPYTLVQDYTLISVLGEATPKIWLEKVDFIEKYHGMVLVNSHPDYLSQKNNWDVYHEFLIMMKNRGEYWHALPRDVARWWRNRANDNLSHGKDADKLATATLISGELIMGTPLVQGL